MLAELLGRSGSHDLALSTLRQALTTAQSTGERYFEPELRRLEGQLLLAIAPANSDQAERCFEESLAVAARHRARSLEFRAALSLARLWCERGRTVDARRLIERTGAQLTDAHDTPDWQAAQTLMRSLS
jgi:predicted ATPase